MNAWTRRTISVAAAWLILGIAAPASGIAGDHRLVRGIVDSTDESVIAIEGNRYDLTGAPIRNEDGTVPKHGDDLRGKLVEIRYFRGRIVSVTVSFPKPQ
jgi:hypothetical protein